MKRHGLTVVGLTGVLIGGSFAPVQAAAPEVTGHIIYVRANPAQTDEVIGSMNADGSAQRKISKGGGVDVAPAYSLDGQRIAFTTLRDVPPGHKGNLLDYSELYVANSDGTGVARVTDNERLVDWQPTWSPDGNEILVARGPSIQPPPDQLTGPTDLWIINLSTGQERQLTSSPDTWEGYADWSPDGSRIVFEGDLLDPGNFDIYTIGVDGSGLQRLTTSGSDFQPVYAPDSQYIAFASGRDGHNGYPDIFRMRADGTQQTNLTRTRTVMEWDPDWGPG